MKYDKSKVLFYSLLGISYYLTKNMLNCISNNICDNSYIVFDYPNFEESKETETNQKLAKGANEEMKSKYSYNEIVDILADNNFKILKHLDDEEMTSYFFNEYNMSNSDTFMKAPKGVSYCLAVKEVK